ncbi:hypothetical protein BFS13_09860 [Pantoea sp. Ae16]|nr:hypothetical protein BFS13_09860 [Pantoea sp. Ae16]
MYSQNPNAAGSHEQAAIAVIFLMAAALCWVFFSDFVRWSCWVLYWLWRLSDFPLIHRYAAERINLPTVTGNNAEFIAPGAWRDVINHSAGILFVPLLPLLTVAGWLLARHPGLGLRSRRTVNIHLLPRIIMTFAPSVIPATRVSGSGERNVQTRLGVRAFIKGHSAIDEGKNRTFQPFIEAN